MDIEDGSQLFACLFVCLFDLIHYVPVNILSVMVGWVFLG